MVLSGPGLQMPLPAFLGYGFIAMSNTEPPSRRVTRATPLVKLATMPA
jgi:hypothetical protein